MVTKQCLYKNSIKKIAKTTGYHILQKLGRTKKVIRVGKISEKCDILTVEGERIALVTNKMKRSLEITPSQILLEARWLKVSKMWIKKQIEK